MSDKKTDVEKKPTKPRVKFTTSADADVLRLEKELKTAKAEAKVSRQQMAEEAPFIIRIIESTLLTNDEYRKDFIRALNGMTVETSEAPIRDRLVTRLSNMKPAAPPPQPPKPPAQTQGRS